MSASGHTYPVHVDATMDTGLSRWLWLLKWVMVIPHYLVLVFLWATFVLLSVVALFAILFTGRYPRGIFEFNVGVLRWSWRVAYYAYGALGTDRYPPFTLDEVPDYPAHLSVDYPEHLSRGLVLVKWWLLALPHYLVVALLAGTGGFVAWTATDYGQVRWTWGGGLIGLLVLVAAVVLLVTGRYPQPIFDLVLGLNRWVLRVAAYAGLMTDEYPPFRLDLGGPDPGGAARVALPAEGSPAPTSPAPTTPTPTTPAPRPPAPAPSTSAPWSTGRVLALVAAGVVFLVGGGLLTAGATLGVAAQALRGDAGFLMSPSQQLSTTTSAVVSEPLTLGPRAADDLLPRSFLGEVAMRADAGQPVFLGVAEADDVAALLAGAPYVRLTGIETVDGAAVPMFDELPGLGDAPAPGSSDIWAASTTGAGERELVWEPEAGDWVVVLMNPDGSPGVAADVSVGATLPAVGGVVVTLLVVGGLLVLLALGMALGSVYGGRGGRPDGRAPAAVEGPDTRPHTTP